MMKIIKNKRHRLRLKLSVVSVALCEIILLLSLAGVVVADTNIVWDFGVPAQYSTPQPQYLEVANSNAHLILQAQNIYHNDLANYLANSAFTNLAYGSDVSLQLSGSAGSYGPLGIFKSGVLDGGFGNNVWRSIKARVVNDGFLADTNIVLMLRMDNDKWLDYVSMTNYCISYSNAVMVSESKYGNGSGSFNGLDQYIYAKKRLVLGGAFTISFWVKADQTEAQDLNYIFSITKTVPATPRVAVRMGGTYTDASRPPRSIGLWVEGGWSSAMADSYTDASDAGVWRHIVITYDSSVAQPTHIYKDLVDLPIFQQNAVNSVNSDNDRVHVGALGTTLNYRLFDGLVDELIVFNRALSSNDVALLNQNYSRLNPLKMQVRSDDDSALLPAKQFVGPDGTTNTYYYNEPLFSSGDFNTSNQYAQYKAYFSASSDRRQTPQVDSVLLEGTECNIFDNTLVDFQRGEFTLGVTNKPSKNNTPYLGAARHFNGGFYTNATYTSGIFNTGGAVNWGTISWQTEPELAAASTPDVTGLWGLNGSWGGDVGAVFGAQSGTPGWATYPKLGSGSAKFNGTDLHVDFAVSTNTQSIEFWINNDNVNDGVMECDSAAGTGYLIITNRMLSFSGLNNAAPSIYVNGNAGMPKLIAGWNHVALVFPSVSAINNLDVGWSNGDYMQGMLDELAVYSRAITRSEIKEHFVLGRRQVAGSSKIVAQICYGNSLPLSGVFTGPGGAPGAYFSSGQNMAVAGQQYIQYRLYLKGDGGGTPAVDSVSLEYGSGSYVVDDEHSEFAKGNFDSNESAWYGDEIKLLDLAAPHSAGLIIDPSDAGARGLWHMDESTWSGGGPKVRDTIGVLHGFPAGGANTAPSAKVGTYCGSFDGNGDYVTLPDISLATDFTVSLWFSTTATNRTALISTDDGSGYYTLEINGEGTGVLKPGRLCLIVNNGVGTTEVVVADRIKLNDGAWHYVVGQREGTQIHIYVDGERAGTKNIGGAFGGVGGGIAYIARNNNAGTELNGLIDEVAIWSRALSESEIGGNFRGGFQTQGEGTYVSKTLDNGGDPSIWQTLNWVPDAPYGMAMQAGSYGLLALWNLEDMAFSDDESGGFDGAVGSGSPSITNAGRFGSCLSLPAGATVSINYPDDLNPASITVEAWVKMNAVASATVFKKNDGANDGYILATDANGKPYFKVDDAQATSSLSVRAGKWTHLAGAYNGSRIYIYIDGEMVGSVSAPARTPVASPTMPASIGGAGYDGLIDQVAVHDRALSGVELLDHYKAGAVTLKFQARAWDPLSQTFVGPDRTSATYFTDFVASDIESAMDLGRNFQYKVTFDTENYKYTPELHGVKIYVANYPAGNPYVTPNSATYTPGRLLGFSSDLWRLSSNADAEYQISPNAGTSWYYWNTSSNKWAAQSGSGYPLETSSSTEISNNILSFYDQLVEPTKTGPQLKFKAYLHSDGAYQINVSNVVFRACPGRVLVTSPNGTENGKASWIVNVPQVITWSSDGIVSSNLTIELWQNSGTNFLKTLTNGYPNIGSYTTVVHDTAGTGFRIKIKDANDINIWDMSDGDLELKYGYHLIAPNGGEPWRIGQTNTLIWQHPSPKLDDNVDFWFSYDGLSNAAAWTKVPNAANVPNPVGLQNTYGWLTPTNDWRFVSENAVMAVVSYGMPNPLFGDLNDILTRDFSDAAFTMAGIAIMYPQAGTGIKNGNSVNVTWAAGGVGTNGVKIELWNGLAWSTLASNAPCVAGTNNSANVPIVGQTEEALIRITSIQNPSIVGTSYAFTIADINIIEPFGGAGTRSLWEIGTTNYITWTAGGAGSNVNVRFTCDEMSNTWIYVASNYPNINSTTITNVLQWIIPGPPSQSVKLRVESSDPTKSDLFAQTDPAGFSMLGLKLNKPDRDSDWPFIGMSNKVEWLNVGGAGGVAIDISYDSGATYEFVTNAYSLNAAINSVDIGYGQLRRPSERARIRLTQSSTALGHPFVASMADNYLVRGIAMHSPSNGVTLNLGSNVVDSLQWFSTRTGDPVVQLYYSSDGGSTYPDEILRSGGLIFNNTDDGDSWNTYAWPISRKLKPSLTAKVKVVTDTGYSAQSTAFTMRGIRIIYPPEGGQVNIGDTVYVQWDFADVFNNAKASNYVSTAGMTGSFTKQDFTNNSQMGFGSVAWTIPIDIEPTTNAVVMMDVFDPPADADVTAYSLPFTIAGIKVKSPAAGTNWLSGTQQNIKFTVAGVAPGAQANIYYAPDGVTFDMTKPIVQNYSIVNGDNTYPWNIENSSALTRLPSTNAAIRVVSGIFSTDSKRFSLSGIKVTRPKSGDVWAVSDGTNTIDWTGVNIAGNYNISYTVQTGDNLLLTYPYTASIASGVVPSGINNSFDWAMVSNSIGSAVVITIAGGGFTNVSEVFEIVPKPSVRFTNPRPGDYLKVTSTNVIQWVRGGNMVDNFELWVTYSDNSSSRLATSGGGISLTNGVFSYEWRDIPNRLGITKLVATNLSDSSIFDVVTNFNIVPTFIIPTFSSDLYALKNYNVSFTTKGSVGTGADFYYTTDENRDPASWVHINPGDPFSVSHNETLLFPWTVADARDPSVYLRIQDHSYTQRFSAAVAGPFDDYGPFAINYYRVEWYVYDVVDGKPLANLSTSDNLGYSAAGLTCASTISTAAVPIVHYYPYGNWDTVWFREFFHDKAVLGWNPSITPTNTVFMERSEIEPTFNVMANFVYDGNKTNFLVNSWLERGGSIVNGATNCTLRIYDSLGNSITNISKTTTDNGIFWQNWSVAGRGYTQKDVFFARVEITFSGATYSSGLTFMMRLAATSEEIGANYNVMSTYTYLMNSSTFAIYSWLEQGGMILSAATNCWVRISKSDTGAPLADLQSGVVANGVFQDNWDVSGLGYNDTDVFFGRTEIDYMGNTYSAGQTFMMRLAASDAITNVMSEVAGIGTNMASVSTNVAAIRTDVTSIRGTVSTLRGDIGGDIAGMSNRLESVISNAKSGIIDAVVTNTLRLSEAITGIGSLSNQLVNIIGPTVSNVWNNVQDIYTNTASDTSRILTRPTTVKLGDTVTMLYKTRKNQLAANVRIGISPGGYSSTMSEIVGGMGIYERDVTFSWGAGTYIVTCQDPGGNDSMVIECVAELADATPGLIAGLSNRLDQIGVQVGTLGFLTNSMASVESQMADVTTLINGLAGISTADIMTGLDDLATKIQTVRTDISGIDTKSIESGVNEVKSAVAALDMSALNRLESQISGLANDDNQNLLGKIESVASQIGQVGNDASDAAQNAQQAKTAANTAATGIEDLKAALAVDDMEESLKAIAEVRKALAATQDNLGTMTGAIGEHLGGRMNAMLEMMKDLAEKDGFKGLMGAAAGGKAGEGAAGAGPDETNVDGLNQSLQEMKGRMVHMQELLNEAAYKPVVTETLLGEK